MLRTGEISSMNLAQNTARVKFDDMDNMVSAELKAVKEMKLNAYKIGDRVICAFVENSEGDGYILGGVI